VATATAEVDRAERSLAAAQAAEEAATGRVEEITASIADLRARLPLAQDEAREAARVRKAAEREVAAAKHRLARIDGG
jgi:chromosome segregation ATPase